MKIVLNIGDVTITYLLDELIFDETFGICPKVFFFSKWVELESIQTSFCERILQEFFCLFWILVKITLAHAQVITKVTSKVTTEVQQKIVHFLCAYHSSLLYFMRYNFTKCNLVISTKFFQWYMTLETLDHSSNTYLNS